jgi:hypothetical protein
MSKFTPDIIISNRSKNSDYTKLYSLRFQSMKAYRDGDLKKSDSLQHKINLELLRLAQVRYNNGDLKTFTI